MSTRPSRFGRIAHLVRKDLLRKRRSPLGILTTLSFPIVFSLVLALAFGGDGGGTPTVQLLVENRDDGPLGNVLASAIASEQAAEYFEVEAVGPEGRDRIESNDGSALLRIPETFTADLLAGTPVALELVRNPAQGILPEIAEQAAGVLVDVIDAASRALREPLETIDGLADSEVDDVADADVAAIAVAVNGALRGASRYLDPIVIELDTVTLSSADETDEQRAGGGFSIFAFVFPGVSVWALFVIGDVAMRDVLTEHAAGTLRRQLGAPLGSGTLIVAKAVYTAVVAAVALVVLTATGAVAVDSAVDPIGFVALSGALVLAVTGASAAIYGATGDERRGATVAAVVYLFLGFAGGSFIDTRFMPGFVQAIAPVSPFYWGTEGYRTLIRDGGDVVSVLPAIGVLAVTGAVLLAVGAALLGRRVATGGSA